jgi:hypothetical protein
LSDADEQLGAIKVLRRPGGGVLRTEPGSERGTGKARGSKSCDALGPRIQVEPNLIVQQCNPILADDLHFTPRRCQGMCTTKTRTN